MNDNSASLPADQQSVWPDRLRIRDTGLHDDLGGLGQRIYTTAGQGYEKRDYVRADLALPANEWPKQMVWRSVSNGTPPYNRRVLAYAEGAKAHSDASWRRNGFVFMVAWDSAMGTVGPGWARRFYDDACRQLDADFITITHWMPLEVPDER